MSANLVSQKNAFQDHPPIPDSPSNIISKYITSANFCLLLLLSIIGTTPVAIFGEDVNLEDGSGDAIRQGSFVVLFGMILVTTYLKHGGRFLLRVPIGLIVLQLWLWLSIDWAIDPLTSFRRVAFSTIVMLCVLYVVRCLSPREVINNLTRVFAVIIIVDWVSMFLFPLATHQVDGPEPALAGNWRGVHLHKNEAGAFCAICILLFIYKSYKSRSYISGPILISLSAIFLYMSKSKTSIGFLPIALIMGAGSKILYLRPKLRTVLLIFSIIICLLLYILYEGSLTDRLADLFADPAALTGRVQIWPIMIDYAHDHALSWFRLWIILVDRDTESVVRLHRWLDSQQSITLTTDILICSFKQGLLESASQLGSLY